MRRVMKAAGLLAVAVLASAGAAVTTPDLPGTRDEPELLAPNGRRGTSVDLNEIRIYFAGGYGGDWIRRSNMRFVRSIHGMTFYKVNGRLYVDRDGDRVIDAGAFYVPRTGLVLADWNCDGRGDQILLSMRPVPKGSWEGLLKRVREEGAKTPAR
ncbi:hypothetical protein [Caulobacter endophyticus]|uniref:hypothetical protein n=1 Tax=Caulobacter endophyticus TaxID=2172652 RepID=UPI00240EBBF0|nr:hypothetical protein [Caulobacter endophyticus]MDG2530520.1 hypothetical protein [Caulobacter endophyticus]